MNESMAVATPASHAERLDPAAAGSFARPSVSVMINRNALSVALHVIMDEVREFALAASKVVLRGRMDGMVDLAHWNVLGLPHRSIIR